jgi:hypothetical protein
LEDGPPRFPRDSSCPAVLRVPLGCVGVSHTGLSPSMEDLSRSFCYPLTSHIGALQPPRQFDAGLGSSAFARRYLRNLYLISSPPGTEMFQFPGFAPGTQLCTPIPFKCTVECRVIPYYRDRVSPFGHLRIKACLAAPRSFSQLTASFIASQRQGIHRLPFLA